MFKCECCGCKLLVSNAYEVEGEWVCCECYEQFDNCNCCGEKFVSNMSNDYCDDCYETMEDDEDDY